MYELKKITGNSYYIASPSNIGLYLDGQDVYLIDSGNDDEAAKKVLKILKENHWQLKMIINTHHHADHTGGNNYLTKYTSCQVYIHPLEVPYLLNPELEIISMWGGVPIREYLNKKVIAKPTPKDRITDNLPPIFQIISQEGHSPNMIAIKTPDNVLYIGDALLDPAIINKYNVCYLYDVEKYFASLKVLTNIDTSYYVPSHGVPITELTDYLAANINKTLEIGVIITNAVKAPKTIEDLVQILATKYQIPLTNTQYVLISTTIKGYLKYLIAQNIVKIEYLNNKQYIIITEQENIK